MRHSWKFRIAHTLGFAGSLTLQVWAHSALLGWSPRCLPQHLCCCAVQVPLQLGAAFTAAAQHNSKSPATQAALYALNTFLRKAADAGTASTTATIHQQLLQSGMLQPLSAVLAALTAHLLVETADLADGGWDAVTGELGRFTATEALQSRFAAIVRFSTETALTVKLTSSWSASVFGLKLHIVTTAAQQGVPDNPSAVESCLLGLVGIGNAGVSDQSLLGLHMCWGVPEGLMAGQRQLYSLLSTVQKLSTLQTLSCPSGAAHELFLGQRAANRGCWNVGTVSLGCCR
jgi:hypothetical protein